MKSCRSFSQQLLWSAVVLLMIAMVFSGVSTNLTVRSIEKNLPATLLEELYDLSLVLEHLAQVVFYAESAVVVTSEENYLRLKERVDIVYDEIAALRNTYVFDNLVHASAFHAVTAPAISDLKIWLSEGVSGYEPQSKINMEICRDRINSAYEKARTLSHASQKKARSLLHEQRDRLDHFLFSANLLFILGTLITSAMVYLMIRQQKMQKNQIETQARLKRQRDLLDSLFDNLPLGITVWSHEGALMKANKGFVELTGYSTDDIRGLDDWFPKAYPDPDYRNQVMQDWSRSARMKKAVRDFKISCKNGNIKHIEFRGHFLSDGRALVSMADITERKNAENNLIRTQSLLQASIEQTPAGILIADAPDVNIRLANSAALGIRGESETLLTEIPYDLHPQRWQVLHPDRTPFDPRELPLTRAIIEGKTSSNVEAIIRRSDGEERWITVNAAPVKDQKGNIISGVVVFLDITEQKLAREEKIELERRLRQAQKMEAIGTLAGGIAHDFNNLLMGIQGRASLIRIDLDPDHPYYEHIQGIETYVKSAADLTRQLLGFARGGKYEIKPIDVNDLVRTSASMFGRTRKEIQIRTHLQEPLMTVEADGRQIEQVLLNLYLNAWQAMPGGGKIHIETSEVTLDEEYCKAHDAGAGHYVKISVTDTGIGMEEDTLQRIFDPFFTTREKARGTGLGLASSYGIVKNHGGIINAYSKKGMGTTMNLYFPCSRKPAKIESTTEQTLCKGTETILLIDDEQMIIEVGSALLEKLGYTVLTASGGKAAKAIMENEAQPVDLIILDLIMPGMDGSETFDMIRQLRPHVPVMLSSGYSANGQASIVMKKGCCAFIQKPFSLNELSKKVRKVLSSPDNTG